MDFSCDETDNGLPVQMHSLREFEQHLNDLKKENFSLKLRIYFLEEKIQQKFEESGDDVHKRNIELKVEVEGLKKELEEKQQLLDKTQSTAESLSNQNEAELQCQLVERQQEIKHMQEILESKVKLLQKETLLARAEAERMASLADSEARRCLALEREMEESGGGQIGQQDHKDRLIEELTQQKHSLGLRVEELEARVLSQSSFLEQKEQEAEKLVGEQWGQLTQYESAAGQCISELQKAQDQVCSLQAKIRQSEARNQKLQEHLADMELELCSAQEEARGQERNIQNITDSLTSREEQVAELCRVIEDQNKMLCSLKELAHRSQLQASGVDSVRGQEILTLQASLFQAQLELQAGQRAQQQAARTREDLGRALQRLEEDLQGALQHRRDTERHNLDLKLALDKARSALLEREEQLREAKQEWHLHNKAREATIRELKTSLLNKEQLIEDCEVPEELQERRDCLLQKLRQRIKERDRALERAVDDKFCCVEEKEEESRCLRLRLREKERDIERQSCVLANNEETITSLEVLLRGRSLELEQVRDACRNIQRHQQESQERHDRAIREQDAIINQLRAELRAGMQEAQDLRCTLLARIQSAPSEVLEELKVRLQLKDHLFQEVLADRAHQALEHHEQVQDLLKTLSSRDQYIQDSASRLGEVMVEQTARMQELRQQLSSDRGWRAATEEVQALQEELRLALRRDKENQELSRNQATMLDSLTRTLHMKDELIRDFQRKMVEHSDLPLVEQLTQEVQELRESLVRQGRPPARGHALGHNWPGDQQDEFEEVSSEGDEDDDLNNDYTDEESGRTAQTKAPLQDAVCEGQGLVQLVEQKRAVERELGELKAQLEKAGFTSLSQMRKMLFSLQAENTDLKHHLTATVQLDGGQSDGEPELDEEEELDVTIEGVEEEEEEEISEVWEAWNGELTHPEEQKKDPAQPGVVGVTWQQSSRDLQERLTAVQQDSKQIQVDLQDLGYETCGRSENEAEREDTSSPEFDDLEMCTSLDCGSQWWPSSSSSSTFTKATAHSDDSSLRRLVEDLRSQLSGSQAVIRGLQNQLHSLSTSSNHGPSAPRKVNWSLLATSPSQSGTEDDEGWQSSDGGTPASPRHPHSDKGLKDLASRVDALENQLRKGSRKSVGDEGKSFRWPGKFDSLIQTQARELSHLRQRLREGRGVCSILTQHLEDITKAFEELLRANDIDFYMGQSFREQLAQSSALAQRISTKISSRDHPEDPEEKTELLAIRLSKELQQKDKIIESLRAKLNLHHHPQRSDTPCSSHALSEGTDQLDRISYVSDEHGSTNEDLELCSDVDATTELTQRETGMSSRLSTDCHSHCGAMSHHLSAPSSITSSHHAQSWLSCPSMPCSSSPHKPTDVQSHSAAASASFQHPPPNSSTQSEPLPLRPHPGGVGFSLVEVHQELQMLQRQLEDHQRSKPLQGLSFIQQPDPSAVLPLSYHGYQPSPFCSALDANSAIKAGASLLESSALWDIPYGTQPARLGADLSSGSSGYQSGTSHTGSDLMKEHLREIRSLRQRLEDSIETNDRLRQQLEERLARTATDKGGPTNIYIQGLDSVGQLSTEIRLLKEENLNLQNQLKQATRGSSKEMEQLREAVLLQRAKSKEAELEAERWAEQSRSLQSEAVAHSQEITQLKQDRQKNQEAINRLQHEVSVLQQQLCESRSLVHSLQCELQVKHSACAVAANTHSARTSGRTATFDPAELQLQLEQQLSRRPPSRRRIFSDKVPSPPVRDTGLIGPSSHQHPSQKHNGGNEAVDKGAPGSSFTVGRVDDFMALQQQILQGGALLREMVVALYALNAQQELNLHKPSDSASVRKLLSDAKMLRQILEEVESLLLMFWRAGLPNTEEPKQDQSLRDEVVSLRLKLSEQEQALKDAMERVKSSNHTKDSLEHFIVGQLSRTRDVLRRAKTNLQENESRISILHRTSPSSSSFCSSFSSSHLCPGEDKNSGGFHEFTIPPCWSVMRTWTPLTSSSSSSAVPGLPLHQRPLQSVYL